MKSIDAMPTGSTAHGLTSHGSEQARAASDAASMTAASMLNRCSSSSAHCCRRPAGVTMIARSHQPRCSSSDEHQPRLYRLARARLRRPGETAIRGRERARGRARVEREGCRWRPAALREARRRRAVRISGHAGDASSAAASLRGCWGCVATGPAYRTGRAGGSSAAGRGRPRCKD